ncbi:MAG TPA: hypothetical protein VG676_13420, partial [Chitinophagaceae bacterium]|nr:hypothetical protein [Chitinophagaceae bacterium]
MDTIQQPTPPPPPSYSNQAPSRGMFGTRIPSTVAFAVGILLFLLPFSEIKCSNAKFTNTTVKFTNTGLNIALGKEWKRESSNLFGTDNKAESSSETGKINMGNAQYFAIAALVFGMIGLLLSFINAQTGGYGGVVTGLLSAGTLLGMMFEIKKWFNDSMAKNAMDQSQNNADSFGLDKLGNTLNDIKPTLNFTPWFYVAMVAFLAAAFF